MFAERCCNLVKAVPDKFDYQCVSHLALELALQLRDWIIRVSALEVGVPVDSVIFPELSAAITTAVPMIHLPSTNINPLT